MKKLIFLSLVFASFTALAATDSIIFPRVYNYGSSVQVTIWNHTDRSVTCMGSVYMTTQSGKRDTEYFNDYVMARFTSNRSIYSRDISDRIVSVSHSISCF